MTTVRRFLGPVALVALATANAGETKPVISKEEVFDLLRFDTAQREKVLGGEIVSREFEELSDKELAVTMAILLPLPMDKLVDTLRSGKLLEHDRELLGFGTVHDDPTDEDFRGMEFTAEESGETRALLGAEPGSKFNLGAEEHARFAELRKRFSAEKCGPGTECARAAMSEYRSALKERVAAYRARGLGGIPPYAREGGKTSDPGQELRTATKAMKVLSERLPEVFRAFAEYPKGDQRLFEHKFVWLKQSVQDRPTFALSHRCLHVEPALAFLAERQFYVGQSYNSLQVVAGAFPMGDKTLLFYLNRTSTDQVAGFMSGTRHSVGRKMMAKELRSYFETLRASLKG